MNQELITAVEAIKTAILQSQYQAAKETTRVQLILYYGIGRYLSSKKGKKTWGTSVLETISSQLRKELPGLRGFSATRPRYSVDAETSQHDDTFWTSFYANIVVA